MRRRRSGVLGDLNRARVEGGVGCSRWAGRDASMMISWVECDVGLDLCKAFH